MVTVPDRNVKGISVSGMVRSVLRVVVRLGLVGAVVLVVAKVIQARRNHNDEWSEPQPTGWPPVRRDPVVPEEPVAVVAEPAAGLVKMAPAPTPVEAPPAAPAKASDNGRPAPSRSSRTAGRRRRVVPADAAWLEPVGTVCPPSHPVKAKLTSMLYHLPGMAAYTRTRPDRCYLDGAAAETDGFTKAKR